MNHHLVLVLVLVLGGGGGKHVSLPKARITDTYKCLSPPTESTRQRAYSLVAQAYTSITAEDFAAFVGYSVEDAVKGQGSSLLRLRRFQSNSVSVTLKMIVYCCGSGVAVTTSSAQLSSDQISRCLFPPVTHFFLLLFRVCQVW